MSDDTRIREVISGWQEKLLQLNRRNNLLYFKAGRRAVSLRGQDADSVDRWLEGSSRWRFAHVERLQRPDDTEEEAEIRVTPGTVDTDVEPVDLQRRLTALYRRDNEWQEEQGLGVLFLAVGWLQWIDEEGVAVRSPLALVPCELERTSPHSPFFLKHRDDRADDNATLQEKLRTFGLDLPTLEEQSLLEYVEQIQCEIAGKLDWSVDRSVVLSTFAYSKLAMYKDLDRMRQERALHPLVRLLAGERGANGADQPWTPNTLPQDRDLRGGRLDDLLKIHDQFTIVDADFSQLRAIDTARRGRNLVIHGPPGTGKSQTIINLIATLLADGKRVLFVSEKSAALDVVKRKLEDCGLGVLCLDLHSERAKKSSVYDQLRASVDEPMHVPDTSFPYDYLENRRSSLNAYVRALHDIRQPLGLTPFEAQGCYVRFRDSLHVDFEVDRVSELDRDRLGRIQSNCNRIARRSQEYREHYTSRWFAFKVTFSSLDLAEHTRVQMERLAEAITALITIAGLEAKRIAVPMPVNAATCDTMSRLIDHLTDCPGIPAHWLDDGVLDKVQRTALEQSARQLRRNGLAVAESVIKAFGNRQPRADIRRIADELHAVSAASAAIKELFGDRWSELIMPDPSLRLAQIDALAEAGRAAVAADDHLQQALGAGAGIGYDPGLDDPAELAEQLIELFGVPADWLHPATQSGWAQERQDLERKRNRLSSAERLLSGFKNGLQDVVDQEMVRRFRTDYRSWWSRMPGSKNYDRWNHDRSRLESSLKVHENLSWPQCYRAVEQAALIGKLRDELDTMLAKFRGTFDGAFDFARVGFAQSMDALRGFDDAFRKTVSIANRWKADRSIIERLLTDPETHAYLSAALTRARDEQERLKSAVASVAGLNTDWSRTSLSEWTRRAMDARTLLQTLRDCVDALEEHFVTSPTDFRELISLVDDMVQIEQMDRDDAEMSHALETLICARYLGAETDWKSILSAVDWTRRALKCSRECLTSETQLPERLVDRLTCASADRHAIDAEIQKAVRRFQDAVTAVDEMFDPALLPWHTWDQASFEELLNWTKDLGTHTAAIDGYLEYRSAVRDLEEDIGPHTVDRIRQATDVATHLPYIVLRRVYSVWLGFVYQTEPALRNFSAMDFEHSRAEYCHLDGETVKAARIHVRRRCFQRYPGSTSTCHKVGALPVLRRELSKKRRQMPVRKLFRRVPDLLQALKPCMLMSPLAVSQYLPRGDHADATIDFDVVIFDEASQIFPEDAVPALARATQAIIAGDSKQLPPTSFFRTMRDDTEIPDDEGTDGTEDEYVDYLAGQESILDAMVALAGDQVAEQWLTVHYRSRHEDLIRYSNHYFYGDRLLTFPAPRHDGMHHLGIHDVYLADGRYDAAATRANRKEADRVVELVFALMRSRPGTESVGVVALSRSQMEMIERILDERRLEHRDLDERFSADRHERFFVKNLENVQGDERDHIILSIGYGPTVGSGAVPNRFGPVNREGGERRLNVAVSRARRSMTVVHSLQHGDIVAKSKGARLLRRLLEYAANPAGAFESHVTVDPAAQTESPFEETVRQALQEKGYRVDVQIGVSGYRVDLGILSESGGGYDLGIECDGATYHSAPAARDRDRLRQQVLEGLGWRIHRVWSTAWARSPDAEVDRIERALIQARESADATATTVDKPYSNEENHGSSHTTERARPSSPDAEDARIVDRAKIGDAGNALSKPSEAEGLTEQASQNHLFGEYETARLPINPNGLELQYESPENVAKLVCQVVDIEGPVHIDILIERIRVSYGLRRSGAVIRQRVMYGVQKAIAQQMVVRTGGFLQRPNGTAVPRRPASDTAPRTIGFIADRELDGGILRVVDSLYNAERDDLIAEVARQFGFKRTGSEIRDRIGRSIDRLVERGGLRYRSGTIALSTRE